MSGVQIETLKIKHRVNGAAPGDIGLQSLELGWRPNTLQSIEGLHDAVRTYACMIFQNVLVSFRTALYGEKQQKTLELSIYFMEGFEISSKCVC